MKEPLKHVHNSQSLRVVPLAHGNEHFSEETVQSIAELAEIYRSIHKRLISEGYVIKDGKIYKEDIITL